MTAFAYSSKGQMFQTWLPTVTAVHHRQHFALTVSRQLWRTASRRQFVTGRPSLLTFITSFRDERKSVTQPSTFKQLIINFFAIRQRSLVCVHDLVTPLTCVMWFMLPFVIFCISFRYFVFHMPRRFSQVKKVLSKVPIIWNLLSRVLSDYQAFLVH